MSSRFQQCAGIEAAPLQDEVILFHAPTNKFCVLNRTSSFIWSQLQQPRTKEQLASQVGSSFSGVTETQANADVDSTLQEMIALGLVVTVE